MIFKQTNPIKLVEVTDPNELEQAHRRRAQFDKNLEWLKLHAEEVYTQYRGKHLCISGENVFAADTPEEAARLALAAHPNDEGRFVTYIPPERMPRIHALAG